MPQTNRMLTMDLRLTVSQTLAGTPVMHGTLALDDDTIEAWCLALVLLKYQMLDHLRVISRAGGNALQIRLEPQLRKKYKTSRGRVTEQDGAILLALSPDEIEYWLGFSLKFYRDGMGRANHIDFDTLTGGRGLPYHSFQLALTVPRSEF